MIDKNMIALAEIRYGYTLPKYGNLTLEQNSLISILHIPFLLEFPYTSTSRF